VVCVLGIVFLYQGTYTFSCQFSVDFSVCGGGSCVMAVSASNARARIQSLGLECRSYLGPFSSSVISCSECQ